jgi:RsiW-degrading membrane proteinase PrsW (M82 family)
MWNFLKGMLIVRATGTARPLRLVLLMVLIGAIVAGVIYAVAVFHALQERSSSHHVQHHSTR